MNPAYENTTLIKIDYFDSINDQEQLETQQSDIFSVAKEEQELKSLNDKISNKNLRNLNARVGYKVKESLNRINLAQNSNNKRLSDANSMHQQLFEFIKVLTSEIQQKNPNVSSDKSNARKLKIKCKVNGSQKNGYSCRFDSCSNNGSRSQSN